MSDTVAVALIAVTGTLSSGLLGYLAARRNTEVQLAGVEVELEHLRQRQHGDARQERLDVYLQFLNSLEIAEERFRGFHGDLSMEDHHESITAIGRAFNRVALLGSEMVIKMAEEAMDAVADFSEASAEAAEANPGLNVRECHQIASEKTMEKWAQSRNAVRAAMKVDVARPPGAVTADGS